MATTKTKRKVITGVTHEEAQDASQQYATYATHLSKIEAKMNEEINKVKDKYQDVITDLQENLVLPVATLEAYAKEQLPNWGKKKSAELLHCIIGFRTGTPKVIKDKKFTWDGVTELVKKLFPDLIRTKTELDKESIIALRKEDGFKVLQEQCFIDVVQEDSFYADVKKEEIAA